MDPVAQQFLQQLDDAGDTLPDSVRSGVLMCGPDAVPGLVERLAADRPEAVQRHAAELLGTLRDVEALPALVAAFGRGPGSPAVTRAVGDAIRSYGPAMKAPVLEASHEAAYPAAARVTLLSLVMNAGLVDDAVEARVAALAPESPQLALQLMASWPRAAWLPVVRAHRSLFQAVAPALTSQVSLACLSLVQGASAQRMAEVQQVLSSQADYAARIAARAAAAAKAAPPSEEEG